MPIITSPTHFG